MNFAMWAIRALAAVPSVVHLIEAIHGGIASGATKKQLAFAALGLSAQAAEQVDPQHADAYDAVAQHIGNSIDSAVAVANIVKSWSKPVAVPSASVDSPPVIIIDPDKPAPTPTPVTNVTSSTSSASAAGPGLHKVVPA